MARRLAHDVDVDVPAAEMYGLVTGIRYWEALVEFYRDTGSRTEVTHFSSDETGTDVTFTHIMSAQDLPSLARRVVPGSFVVTREQHFDPFDPPANRAVGRFRTRIPAPVEVTGDYALWDLASGSRMRLESACRVQVPIIGAQIENLVLGGLKMLFAREGEFTSTWVTDHR